MYLNVESPPYKNVLTQTIVLAKHTHFSFLHIKQHVWLYDFAEVLSTKMCQELSLHTQKLIFRVTNFRFVFAFNHPSTLAIPAHFLFVYRLIPVAGTQGYISAVRVSTMVM